MKFIAHRANLYGRNIDTENSPSAIEECLNLGFDIEVDIWFKNDKFYLGHDEPKYEISLEKLQDHRVWCHCKNDEALFHMIDIDNTHYFWHDQDRHTITSNKIIWTYPGFPLSNNSVCVLPEKSPYDLSELKKAYGICSDHIVQYMHSLK